MLLIQAVVMVSQFVHEDVKQGEGAGLGLGETALDSLLADIVGQSQLIEHNSVVVEIRTR